MRALSHWVMIVVSLVIMSPVTLLAGCGGGGSSASAASAVTTTDPGSKSASGTVASTLTATPSPAATVSPTGGATGTPTPSPSATPTGGTGAHTFSGKITDEQGTGLPSVAVKAQEVSPPKRVAGKLAYTPSATEPLTTQTSADGSYALPGLSSNQYYALSIYRYDRKTLRTVFKFDPNSSDQSILLIAPRGTGVVQFQLPTQRTLNVSSLANDAVMAWDTSTNSGFASYTVYRGSAANQGLAATEVSTFQSPTDTGYKDTYYTDHKITTPPLTYYRLYEKVFLPELGNFVLMGSNEVSLDFPQVTISPQNLATDVPTASKIEFRFTAPVDQNITGKSLTVTSHGDTDEVVVGTSSWSANTLTFTPTVRFKLARTITARLSGAQDTRGNTLQDQVSRFTIAGGYSSTPGWYAATLPSGLSALGCDTAGILCYSYTVPSATGADVVVRNLAAYQGLGATDGSYTESAGAQAHLDFFDTNGDMWIYRWGVISGFFSQLPVGSAVGYYGSSYGGALTVDFNYPQTTIKGDLTANSTTITGVSATDLEKVTAGIDVYNFAFGYGGSTYIKSVDKVQGTITLYNAASSSASGTTITVGPSVVAYGITTTPTTIGAPLNLDAGGVTLEEGAKLYDQNVHHVTYMLSPPIQTSNPLVPPGARGAGVGQYSTPSGVVADSAGNIYIADNGNSRVVVFDRTSIKQHTGTPPYPGYIGSFGSAGAGGYGKFGAGGMGQILIDKYNYVYVVDAGNGLIQKFAGVGVSGHQLGDFITQFTYNGASGSGVTTPVCIDPTSGNLYSITYNAATLMNTSITKTVFNPNP